MALPARSMGLAGASTQSLLPPLWRHLDAPGVHAGDEAPDKAFFFYDVDDNNWCVLKSIYLSCSHFYLLPTQNFLSFVQFDSRRWQ